MICQYCKKEIEPTIINLDSERFYISPPLPTHKCKKWFCGTHNGEYTYTLTTSFECPYCYKINKTEKEFK